MATACRIRPADECGRAKPGAGSRCPSMVVLALLLAGRRRRTRPLERRLPGDPSWQHVGRRGAQVGMPAAGVRERPGHQPARDRPPRGASHRHRRFLYRPKHAADSRHHGLPPARPSADPVPARTAQAGSPRTRLTRQGRPRSPRRLCEPDRHDRSGRCHRLPEPAHLPRVTAGTLHAFRVFRDRRRGFGNTSDHRPGPTGACYASGAQSGGLLADRTGGGSESSILSQPSRHRYGSGTPAIAGAFARTPGRDAARQVRHAEHRPLGRRKVAEHWADQELFQFLAQIGVLEQPATTH